MPDEDYNSTVGCLWGAVLGPIASVLIWQLPNVLNPRRGEAAMGEYIGFFYGLPFFFVVGVPAGAIVGAIGPPLVGWGIGRIRKLVSRWRG